MAFDLLYVEYGFRRTQDMVRDGERRALRHVNVGPLPPASKGCFRKALGWLSTEGARARKNLRHAVAAATHREQPAG